MTDCIYFQKKKKKKLFEKYGSTQPDSRPDSTRDPFDPQPDWPVLKMTRFDPWPVWPANPIDLTRPARFATSRTYITWGGSSAFLEDLICGAQVASFKSSRMGHVGGFLLEWLDSGVICKFVVLLEPDVMW